MATFTIESPVTVPHSVSFRGLVRERMRGYLAQAEAAERRIQRGFDKGVDKSAVEVPSQRIVFMMLGLPSCGKSMTAGKLAGEAGVVCETDEYFLTQVGDDPTSYDWDDDLINEARRWNFERYEQALQDGVSRVVLDRGTRPNGYARRAARMALKYGYRVTLAEPESPWWQEIKVLLRYRPWTDPVLRDWADELARLSRRTHRVPAEVIYERMCDWDTDFTLEDVFA